jgi:Fur family ferric uptake transcriptional regulator
MTDLSQERSSTNQFPAKVDTVAAISGIVKGLPKGTHMTANEVFEKARQMGLDISLSTVYRTLHRLKVVGDVSTVSGDRGVRYETAEDGEDHDHLICLGCGLTIEFVDDLIRGFGKTVAQRKGFEHKSSRFDILGYCNECNSNDQTHKSQHGVEYILNAIENSESAIETLRQAIDLVQARKSPKAVAAVQAAIEKLQQASGECENSLNMLI